MAAVAAAVVVAAFAAAAVAAAVAAVAADALGAPWVQQDVPFVVAVDASY